MSLECGRSRSRDLQTVSPGVKLSSRICFLRGSTTRTTLHRGLFGMTPSLATYESHLFGLLNTTHTYTFRVPHIVTTILVALTPSFNSSNAFCTSPSPLPTTFGFGLQRKLPFSSAFSRNSYTVGPYSAF